MTLTESDLQQLAARGIAPDEADRQLHLLRNAPPAVVLDRPCTVGDGITRLDPAEHDSLLAEADAVIAAGRVSKFVPASGAATRMFKDLVAARSAARPSSLDEVRPFFERLDEFPFAEELRARAGMAGTVRAPAGEHRLLATLLDEMRYADLPKALIPFHRVRDGVRTPFEEHLLEAAQYAAARDGVARVHFTVAPEYRDEFDARLPEFVARVAARAPGAALSVTFSEQHPSTDTLAATPEGEPFRLDDGSLLLRPAGHGALLRNLEDVEGDLVVIKNIDNVVPHEANRDVVRWKRLLIGCLARLERDVCRHLAAAGPDANEDALEAAVVFAGNRLGHRPSGALADRAARQAFVAAALDRPLRVCGVVRNEGEPGGAPFWIVEPAGRRSAQIVEASQIDLGDADQRRVFESSTHFNPVDLVCAVRRCDGSRHRLADFVDPDAVFLSRKTHDGRELVALERPGLWNGAMARWNTVFVEVPAATFAPVKTVFDLLRPQHQSS